MTEEEQITAIERTLGGDLTAFDELVKHFQEQILRFVWNYLGSKDAALDVSQETFITAYRQLAKYDSHRAKFSTWLMGIARNLSLKSRSRHQAVSMEELPDGLVDSIRSEDQAHWKDSFAKLNQALASLPEAWQRAFILTEIQSLSYEEASQIEAIPIGTIRSRVSRARAHLRATLNLNDLL